MEMRKPAVAGKFYPADASELESIVKDLYNKAPEREIDGTVKMAVVPHAGYMFSGLVAATVYKVLKKHMDDFEEIILLGPAHYVPSIGSYAPEDEDWLFPWGVVKVGILEGFPRNRLIHEPEHSLEVQFPFLHYLLGDRKVYPIAVGQDDPFVLAQKLMPFLENRLLLISTDLSHYYPYEVANKLDSYANECIPKKDIECVLEKVEACGKLPLLAGLSIAKEKDWNGHFLIYMNSGDVWWDKEQVVGYGGYVFTE